MTEGELERLMKLYYGSVYRAALCCVKNPSDADDIAQEVFLKLYTCGKGFESDEHIKAWLLRCAVNKAKDILRSHWYRASLPLEAAENIGYGEENETYSLLPLVMKLSRKNRTVLYMYYYEDYSAEETAAILGIPLSTVLSRLMRGRKQLGKLIESERNDDDELQRYY